MKLVRLWLCFLWLIPILFNPFGHNVFSLFRVSLLSFWLLGMCLLWIIDVLKNDKRIEFSKNQILFFGASLFFFTLNYFFSDTPGSTLWGSEDRMQGILTYLMYFGLAFFLYQYRKLLDKKFFGFGVLVFSLVSVHAILQKIGYGRFSAEMYGVYSERVYATVGHPNFLGQLLVSIVLLSYYLFGQLKDNFWRVLVLFAGGLNLVALIFTENRASWLALFTVVVVMIFNNFKVERKYKLVVLGIVTLGMSVLVLVMAPSLRSLGTRMILWETSLPLVFDQFLFGNGLESFKSIYQVYASADLLNFEPIYSVAGRSHNFLLDVVIEGGLFGLLLIGWYWRSALKAEKSFLKYLWVVSFLPWMMSFPLVEHWILSLIFFVAIFNDQESKFSLGVGEKTVLSFLVGVVFIGFVSNAIFYVNRLSADVNYSFGNYLISNEDTSDDALGVELVLSSLEKESFNYEYNVRMINFVIGLWDSMDGDLLFTSAEIALNNMVHLRGEDFFYNFMRAQLAVAKGDFDNAETYYQNSIELSNSSNPKVIREYAVMNYYKEDCRAFVGVFENYMDLIPDTWELGLDDNLSFGESEKLRIYLKNINKNEFLTLLGFAVDCYEVEALQDRSDYYRDLQKSLEV